MEVLKNKILAGALESIIDITHCTCKNYKQDPSILCPTCLAIAALDEAKKVGGFFNLEWQPIYILELTQQEAKLLKGMVQNPLSDDDPEDLTNFREKVWNALQIIRD